MINKLMIEKFKKCENIINEYDYFNFYTFDEFCNNICLNDDNSIVFLQNIDDDEYVIINFENEIIIHSQNYDIEYVEYMKNVDYTNVLYIMLKTLFCCEYVQH